MNNNERQAKYRKNHQDKIKLHWKLYYQIHKEQIKLYRKLHKNEIQNYRDTHKEERKEYDKNYRQTHKKQRYIYLQNKMKSDINYRLSSKLRIRLIKALKNNWKSGHTLKLLGCSIEELKQHLEEQFVEGMTWKNYGKWHIDHIRPCASFDLSKPEEQAKCFNYTNLQPLWAKDNISKSDKYYEKI
jgi:hypothetical protein